MDLGVGVGGFGVGVFAFEIIVLGKSRRGSLGIFGETFLLVGILSHVRKFFCLIMIKITTLQIKNQLKTPEPTKCWVHYGQWPQ